MISHREAELLAIQKHRPLTKAEKYELRHFYFAYIVIPCIGIAGMVGFMIWMAI